MPSRPAPTSWEDRALGLAWGAWTELGVSGWSHTHSSWAIDPEPLILFTAALGDRDPRLRDEATDWCIRNWRFVSRVRLRNLLRQQEVEVREAFGEFAATVNSHAGVIWPGASIPRRYVATGRSTLSPLERPSMVYLRLRAIFGLAARTEILRQLLATETTASIARLATLTGYAKRNVAEECDLLERAGVLAVRTVANRFYYSLDRRDELEAFLGELPGVFPNWTPLFNVVLVLRHLGQQRQTQSQGVFDIEVHRTLRSLDDIIDDAGLGGPASRPLGRALWPVVQTWADALLKNLAAGTMPGFQGMGESGPDSAADQVRLI